MGRTQYTSDQLDEFRKAGKKVVFNIDESHGEEATVIEAFELTEADRDTFIFADVPKGECFNAFEIIEVGEQYNDAFGDLRKDVLLRAVLAEKHLTNWSVTPETKAKHYPNSRVLRLT